MTEASVAFAALITSIGTLLTAVVGGIVAVKSLKRTELRVADIDHAVNGTDPGERSIRDNVQDLHDNKFEPIPPLVRQIVALLQANEEPE